MQSFKTLLSIRKSTSVRATKYFYLLILAIVSLFLQAYMHNYNIVYVTMFFLVSVALVSTFFGVLNLYPLKIEFLSQARFFANKNGELTVLAHNDSNKAIYDLTFKYQDKELYLNSLGANEKKPLSFESRYESRGRHSLDILKVVSLFPLIHERKFRKFDFKEKIIVYPKPEGVSLMEQLSHKADKSGDMSDFKGVSHFIEGENFSSIHWASLAKNDTLMSKRFTYTQPKEKLHFSFSDLSGSTEKKLSQLTLWVLESSKSGYEFTLDLNTKEFDSTKEEIDAILTELALY